jgi:hypothetical protein
MHPRRRRQHRAGRRRRTPPRRRVPRSRPHDRRPRPQMPPASLPTTAAMPPHPIRCASWYELPVAAGPWRNPSRGVLRPRGLAGERRRRSLSAARPVLPGLRKQRHVVGNVLRRGTHADHHLPCRLVDAQLGRVTLRSRASTVYGDKPPPVSWAGVPSVPSHTIQLLSPSAVTYRQSATSVPPSRR